MDATGCHHKKDEPRFMKLYTFKHSPNPLKIRIALAELSLDCELVEVDLLKGEQKAPEFLKLNPLGKIPILCDGDFILRESNAILFYLGKQYGKRLWPEKPQQEAQAWQWLLYESAHMAPNLMAFWFQHFVVPKVQLPPMPEKKLQSLHNQIEQVLDLLEQHLAHQQYMLGEQFSLVDCAIGVELAVLHESILKNATRWPQVSAYKDAFVARPSWQLAQGALIWDQGQ